MIQAVIALAEVSKLKSYKHKASIWGVNIILPIYGRYAGHIILRANAFCQQPIPYLPGEHRRVLPLVVGDRVNDWRRRDLWLRAAYDASLKATSFIISEKVRVEGKCVDRHYGLKARRRNSNGLADTIVYSICMHTYIHTHTYIHMHMHAADAFAPPVVSP